MLNYDTTSHAAVLIIHSYFHVKFSQGNTIDD